MHIIHPRYICFPSVVCVGKETEVAITPCDLSRSFREDREYKVAIIGLHDDAQTFDNPIVPEHPCYVKNGCLHFSYRFDKEQEYAIRFHTDSGDVQISMYAVEEDLYVRRPLKGDLHSHSYYSDGVDCALTAAADYREEGFDFFALTDHNRFYPSLLAAKAFANVDLGIHIMTGEEIHTPGSLLHIVHIGGTESVCEKYIHQPNMFESEVAKIEDTLAHIPELYRHRMALAVWACRESQKVGGIAIFAHPYWMPQRINVSPEFCDLLFKQKIFDAFELMGGLSDAENNMQVALWTQQLLAGNNIPVVGSSDSHFHDMQDRDFAKRFTIVFAKENTTAAILEAIQNGYSLAAELPYHDENTPRFYCSRLRLVNFAHYLFKNYFCQTAQLCIGEGVLMRRYIQGEDVGAVLSALAPTVESFYKRFYGITPTQGIPQRKLDFVEACREEHITRGPATKGSQLYILPHGRNVRND